ncbi:hypothetical protein [Sphingopyxis sp. JAI128]|uniref:hypothetical protein n=1 Tax=Sphingopyxis sp. JAI128 TaxID=2723066 RepID=UPI00161176D9|nr:hypothetical protein [Sphingopyxis sp. JAI128]MBB6428149.1 hypothetical protein [Sphingopyxis sp. JAI128]
MPPPTMNAPKATPVLRLEYETSREIDAEKIGAIIAEVGKSFNQFERQRGRYRLAIKAAGTGTFWVEFIVLAGAAAPIATTFHKEIIEYTAFLADLISIFSGTKEGRPSAQDKRVVKALNAPVATGQASQLNINVQGNENTVIINGDISICIGQYDDRQKQRSALSGYMPMPDELTKILHSSVRVSIPQLDGHFGTVFQVEGQWYVRLEGEAGVLNPLDLSSDNLAVKHNQAYLLSGQWEGRRYRIWKAEPLG